MKNNTFLLLIVMRMCQIIDGQRSKMGITNILYGKRNHQTWSDIHFFQLQAYYRFLYREDEEIINVAYQELLKLGYIIENENDVYKVTEAGAFFLANNQLNNQFNKRDGRVVQSMEMYWSYLHLLVQTLSNLLYKNRSFLPIVRDAKIQSDVKDWLAKYGVHNGSKGLVNELTQSLEALSDVNSNLLMLRMSGYHRIGLTIDQLSKMYNITYLETKWQWENILCHLYDILQKSAFHYLPNVPSSPDLLLSKSSKHTWELLRGNLSIAEISRIRKLKEATIMDHIIELALIGVHFDHSIYISDYEIKRVEGIYKLSGSKRLKLYKEQLPQLSYFQIRLALTLLDRGRTNETETIFN